MGQQSRIGTAATTKISRKEFGLTWNAALETGGVLMGDEVTITMEVEFVKARLRDPVRCPASLGAPDGREHDFVATIAECS